MGEYLEFSRLNKIGKLNISSNHRRYQPVHVCRWDDMRAWQSSDWIYFVRKLPVGFCLVDLLSRCSLRGLANPAEVQLELDTDCRTLPVYGIGITSSSPIIVSLLLNKHICWKGSSRCHVSFSPPPPPPPPYYYYYYYYYYWPHQSIPLLFAAAPAAAAPSSLFDYETNQTNGRASIHLLVVLPHPRFWCEKRKWKIWR